MFKLFFLLLCREDVVAFRRATLERRECFATRGREQASAREELVALARGIFPSTESDPKFAKTHRTKTLTNKFSQPK